MNTTNTTKKRLWKSVSTRDMRQTVSTFRQELWCMIGDQDLGDIIRRQAAHKNINTASGLRQELIRAGFVAGSRTVHHWWGGVRRPRTQAWPCLIAVLGITVKELAFAPVSSDTSPAPFLPPHHQPATDSKRKSGSKRRSTKQQLG